MQLNSCAPFFAITEADSNLNLPHDSHPGKLGADGASKNKTVPFGIRRMLPAVDGEAGIG
jgi:hypothetical protein